jgi:hypothetical protein
MYSENNLINGSKLRRVPLNRILCYFERFVESILFILKRNRYFTSLRMTIFTLPYMKLAIKATFPVILLYLISINNILAENLPDLNREKLPDYINNYRLTLLPVLTLDSTTLYFDRKYHPENTGGTLDSDEIWCCKKDSSGIWQIPEKVGVSLNRPGADVLFSVTPDGRICLYYGTNSNDSLIEGYYLAERFNRKWEIFKKLNITGYRNLGENYYGSLSSDEHTLILSIEQKGGFGKLDLYVSFFNDSSDTWSNPLNLGSKINTKDLEGSPFLAYDGKTLYFASTGHNGRGKSDLYVTRRLDDS